MEENRFESASESENIINESIPKPKATVDSIWRQFVKFCKVRCYKLIKSTTNIELADILTDWGYNMKKENGEDYTDFTVKTMWNSAAKSLQLKYSNEFKRIFDPFTDIEFKKARDAKNAKRKELRLNPKKWKRSTLVLNKENVFKMMNLWDEETPEGLEKKLYHIFAYELAWRGAETARSKVHFFKEEKELDGTLTNRIEYNPIFSKLCEDGSQKRSESKWIVSNDENPETCPVRLYRKLLSKRGPKITTDRLFLTFNRYWKKPNSEWYKNMPIGLNELAKWTKQSAEKIAAQTDAEEHQILKVTFHTKAKSIQPYFQLDQEHDERSERSTSNSQKNVQKSADGGLQKAKAEAAAAAEGASSSSVENAAKTEIQEPIVIKEEGPDDDLNLILQCESVPDQEPLIEIKAEPVELKEEPLPETTQDFSNFNSTRIIRTYENTKNKNLDFSTRIIRTYENTKKKNLTVGDETQSKPDSTASNKRRNTEISECSNEGRKRVKTDETEICILCTKIFDAPLNDITTLETKILFTTNVIIHEHGMPKKACQSCFEMLDKCYKFKNQVMTAHTLLVDDFFATPMNIPRDLDEISSECDKDEEDSDEETLNYECIVCDSEFLTEKELNEHDVIIHAKLDCKICDFKATDLDKYLEHKKEHVSEETGKNKKFFCEQCGDLVTKHRYDAHILEHKSTKRIECAVCNISVPDTLLKLHMKKHESKFVCKKCGKHFGTQKILKAHTIIEHKRTFVCNICDRAFSVQTKLQQHIQLHTGEKPFACVVCDRRFNNRFNLATHTRIHTNTFPYKCNYCEESFRYNASRKDHQKKKHPEKLEEDMNLLLGEEKE